MLFSVKYHRLFKYRCFKFTFYLAAHTYTYPRNIIVRGEIKYANLQSLQDLAGQTKVATRDDYENEDLYTKMTRHYNVSNF